MTDLIREWRFALREPAMRRATLAAFLLSLIAVVAGALDVEDQRTALAELRARVDAERDRAIEGQSDAGGAAYYAFHLTYHPPSDLAFAAAGVRDTLPWKHRIRMLALEGQIYESDTGNPELAALGRLDFAFVAATLMPLLLVLVLHDLWSGERQAGRLELVCATSRRGERVFVLRAIVRTSMIVLATAIPFLGVALAAGAAPGASLTVLAVVVGHGLVWTAASLLLAKRVERGATTLALLLGLWLTAAVAIPIGGKLAAEASIPVPNGGELLLTQRETVNGAWDRPKSDTMTPFVSAHPRWRDRAAVTRPFEWKWYYAFQWLGDHRAAPMSEALRGGVAARDAFMARVAFLSPTLLTERMLQRAAGTDVRTYLAYEGCVREYHARLRSFYYPMLFGVEAFGAERMSELPEFEPCTDAA